MSLIDILHASCNGEISEADDLIFNAWLPNENNLSDIAMKRKSKIFSGDCTCFVR